MKPTSRALTWAFALGFGVAVGLSQAETEKGPRTWTTADGSKTITAEYLSSRDGRVTIRRTADRKTFTIPLSTLSASDREWVEARQAKMAAGPGGKEKEASEKFAELISGEWERTEGHGLQYRLFGDRKLRRSKDAGYPLVVYLHGRGGDVMGPERPWSAEVFSQDGNYRDRPCFIIAPQNPDQMGWNGEKADGVVAIVKELVDNLPVDENRIYLTGYSMGGFGTFRILADEPELFAAGIPIAGGGSPGSASTIKDIPLWVFHGAKDPTVKVDQSRNIVEALKDEGSGVKYTEYPDGDHGIASQVYADEEMHEWLFGQRRGG